MEILHIYYKHLKDKEVEMKVFLRMTVALILSGFFVAAPCIAAEKNPEIKAFLNQYRDAFKMKNIYGSK